MDRTVKPLLRGLKYGSFDFPSRIVMAAMTRCRADYKTSVPNDLHVQYYSQRANGAAFILTECTHISSRGNSFPGACGISTSDQVEGWKRVTDAVHKNDGRIFLQIWHGGRQGHPDILNGQNPVGPSPIAVRGKCRTFKGLADYPVPEELTEGGINEILDQFRIGAENALKAGFDGIQLHGANGYIVDQFFRDCSNKRSDKYGGNVRNRARFALEVIDILVNVFGKDKVGIKLSPVSRYGDMFDSNPIENYSYLVNELDKKGIMFIEFVEPPEFVTVTDHYGIKGENQIPNVCKVFRPLFRNLIIGNNNFTFETGNQKVEYKDADMISYGKLFISNPDLVERFRNNWELTKPELRYFYSGTEKGYSDYPRYSPAHKL